jgi:hypothetical protein
MASTLACEVVPNLLNRIYEVFPESKDTSRIGR